MEQANQTINVKKSYGDLELFSKEKLYKSLIHAGLLTEQAEQIASQVAQQIKNGIKTKEIFKKSLKLVEKTSHVASINYSLKKAILDLGPDGHNFEYFVAKYFEALGYTTKTQQTVQGKFLQHEVDVIATKDGKRIFTECKFHNRHGLKNNTQLVLYVKARWDDLKTGPEGKYINAFYLASNTAFTSEAITYANGVDLHLLGLNAPAEKPFIEEIKSMCLYPITSLTTINKLIKKTLIEKNILIAKELPKHISLLKKLNLSDEAIAKVLAEIKLLLKCHCE